MASLTKRSGLIILLLLGFFSLSSYAGVEADSVILYTTYPNITVGPGQSIDISIDIINMGKQPVTTDISLSGLPKGWNYNLKGGNYEIRQISVLPGDKKYCNLHLEVPIKVNKGNYRINFTAGRYAVLPLTVVVKEQGSYNIEFTTDRANMQGSTSTTFSYRAVLKNGTADKQLFALTADAPRGWNVNFQVDYKKVTSIEINANSLSTLTIEIDPPDMTEARTYRIPVHAVTSTSSSDLLLEAVVIGTYGMEVTTPTGLLSTGLTAGKEKRIELVIKNTGTAELKDIKFTAGTPVDWQVIFDPKGIDKLEPGNSAQVFATIKAAKKAISGDYLTNMNAKSPEVSALASFRISVKTPLLWGWAGIMIILLALGTIFYLFRKYGRR